MAHSYQKRKFTFRFAMLFFVMVSSVGSALSHEDLQESKELDVNKIIFDHIGDSHDWHILDITKDDGSKKAISVPLPIVLVHTNPFKITTFLSSAFHHGHLPVSKDGYTFTLYNNKIYYASDAAGTISFAADGAVENARPLDFSITKNVATLFLAAVLLLLIFVSVAKAYKQRVGLAPKGLQAFIEPIILFVQNDIVIPNIGEDKYKPYMPFLLTIFFFIWIVNMLGLIPFFPGGANVTGNIAVTFVLALSTLLVINFSGNKHYWRHVFAMPGLPVWLLPIMIPVELIGIIAKPFALMVRLFANITAGHIIVLSLISLIFVFKSLAIAPVSILFVLFMDVLELFVAALQAYIFTMLSALFIGLAVQEHH